MTPTTSTLILTHSDIVTFLRCRRLFRFAVVEDWTKPDAVVGALALGTRVHAALEAFHTTGQDPVDAHTDMANAARQWAKDTDPPTWVVDQLEDDLLIGTNATMAYRRWVLKEDPYRDWDVVQAERTVETPLLGGRVLLRGKIDLLLRADNGPLDTYMVEDWKTLAPTRVTAALDHVLRTFQHGVYASTLAAQDGIDVGKARYIHLKKVKDLSRTKDPVIISDVPVMRRTTAMTLAYVERIAGEILDLIADGDPSVWYPSPQDSCSWCDYRMPCLLATDGRDAERGLLEEKFQHGTRLARYNRQAMM